MIAIATMSAKLATIDARLTIACPGAPRSCANARPSGTERGIPGSERKNVAARGISRIPPTRISAIAA